MIDRYRLIILHVGLGKTGTTSIQGNCYRYRELLLQQGIVYPSFRFRHKNIVNHSDPITAFIASNPGKYGVAFRQQVIDDPMIFHNSISPQMNELLAKPQADTLVLSGESVAECDDIDMQTLLQRLRDHTETLRVIAYIRSPQSSLESILQQRVKSGLQVDLEPLVSTVRERYERLRRNFTGLLETVNFHEAVKHPYGLVAHFMELIGVSKSELQGLAFNTSNERVTLEAYKIMESLNGCYPRREAKANNINRTPHDMHALMNFPGQPFQLENYADSALFQAALREGAWLESELGFRFPKVSRREAEPMWQADSLVSMESAIRGLENENLQAAAAEFLAREAESLQSSRAETAGILRHIAWSLQNIKNNPVISLLENLGADYFKFAALQVENSSTELALNLMSMASELRPGADFIGSRIDKYKEELGLNANSGVAGDTEE